MVSCTTRVYVGASHDLARNWGCITDGAIADLWHQVAMIRYREVLGQALAQESVTLATATALNQESRAVRALRAEQWIRAPVAYRR
jgi:hypothetical protein